MFWLIRLIAKAATLIGLLAWLTGCTKNPVGIAVMNPLIGFVLDDCDEFASTRSAQRMCGLKELALMSEAQRQAAAQQPGRALPYTCRRTLAKPECTPALPPSPE